MFTYYVFLWAIFIYCMLRPNKVLIAPFPDHCLLLPFCYGLCYLFVMVYVTFLLGLCLCYTLYYELNSNKGGSENSVIGVILRYIDMIDC